MAQPVNPSEENGSLSMTVTPDGLEGAEHWHALALAGLDTGTVFATPTMPMPTPKDAKELALSRLKNSIEAHPEEERKILEERHAILAGDLDDVTEGFVISFSSTILAVYDCQGRNKPECAQWCRAVTQMILNEDRTRGEDCDCEVHRSRREAAPDGQPMTGMYL